jgi:hypothetical protein
VKVIVSRVAVKTNFAADLREPLRASCLEIAVEAWSLVSIDILPIKD